VQAARICGVARSDYGEPISMTVTPDGPENVSPPGPLVSFIWPSGPFDQNVVQSFCNYVHYFASQKSTDRWAAGRENIVLLPVSAAFQVGLRAWRAFRGGAHSAPRTS